MGGVLVQVRCKVPLMCCARVLHNTLGTKYAFTEVCCTLNNYSIGDVRNSEMVARR